MSDRRGRCLGKCSGRRAGGARAAGLRHDRPAAAPHEAQEDAHWRRHRRIGCATRRRPGRDGRRRHQFHHPFPHRSPQPSPPRPQHQPPRSRDAPKAAAPSPPSQAADVATVGIDELRTRAGQNEVAAMEELGRRLLQGIDVAEGSAGRCRLAAARGRARLGTIRLQRRRDVRARLHRRAQFLEGRRVVPQGRRRRIADGQAQSRAAAARRQRRARDVKAAVQLLLSAAHQGMAASMFTLGDIYEQGDAGQDLPAALAWFAVTGGIRTADQSRWQGVGAGEDRRPARAGPETDADDGRTGAGTGTPRENSGGSSRRPDRRARPQAASAVRARVTRHRRCRLPRRPNLWRPARSSTRQPIGPRAQLTSSRHPAGAARPETAARQARRQSGANNARGHPRIPEEHRHAADRRAGALFRIGAARRREWLANAATVASPMQNRAGQTRPPPPPSTDNSIELGRQPPAARRPPPSPPSAETAAPSSQTAKPPPAAAAAATPLLPPQPPSVASRARKPDPANRRRHRGDRQGGPERLAHARRTGQGDPDPLRDLRFYRRSTEAWRLARRPRYASTSAWPGSRRPARPTRRCSNSLKEMRKLMAPPPLNGVPLSHPKPPIPSPPARR